jgi:hypothetical protein
VDFWSWTRFDYQSKWGTFTGPFSFTVDGFEYQPSANNLLDVYYGGAYVQKNTAIDLSGQFVGYGYDGSPSNHNRSIQEITLGYTRTFWRDPNYGALQFITQYSYIVRHPWSVPSGDPSGTHVNVLYLDLRYLFPGAPQFLNESDEQTEVNQ